ncbi:Polycystin-1 [Manis pentadactyla]|nr:Polycystin-1 [Manis pentadactyla]
MISLPAEEAMVSGAGPDWGRDTTSSGEPGCKIGYLWLQIVVQKDQESICPEFRTTRLGRLSSPESVASWGLLQSRTPLCLPYPLAWLQNHSAGVQFQSAGFRHQDSGKLFAELAGGGSPGRGPKKPASGAEPTAFSEVTEGGAWSPGCGQQIDPLHQKAVDRSVSRHPGKNQNKTPGLSGKR